MNPIPMADPLGIPAPVWLLQHLSAFTLFLHFIAMNLALGGTLLAALALGRGKGSGNALAAWFFRLLPALVAAVISTAIPPFLFLQVLYGPFYYTSNVLLAAPWFSVLFLLTGGYLLAYLLNFKWNSVKKKAGWIGGGIFLLFSAVGLILTAQTLLAMHPERWSALYDNPHLGLSLDTGVPTLLPRLLHLLLAAPAVAGGFLALVGQYWIRQKRQEGTWTFRWGARWFIGVTLLQVGVGLWHFLSHPQIARDAVLGGNGAATGAFVVGWVFALLALVHYAVGLKKTRALGWIWGGFICLLLTVYSMTALRMEMRDVELTPYLDGMWKVKPQWALITTFLVLLAGGLLTVGWMIWKVFSKPKSV